MTPALPSDFLEIPLAHRGLHDRAADVLFENGLDEVRHVELTPEQTVRFRALAGATDPRFRSCRRQGFSRDERRVVANAVGSEAWRWQLPRDRVGFRRRGCSGGGGGW